MENYKIKNLRLQVHLAKNAVEFHKSELRVAQENFDKLKRELQNLLVEEAMFDER